MKARSEAVFRLAAPLRAAAHRLAFAALVALALVFMILSNSGIGPIDRLRGLVTDIFTPVLDVFSRPAATVNATIIDINGWFHLHADNQRLAEEVRRLQDWEATARRLDAENRAMRDMLNVVIDPPITAITGRVIADSGGAFVRSLLVSAGAADGAAKGQAAVSGEGLVGRVTEVSEHGARILLITDINSRIPVTIADSGIHAILAGDNSLNPHLIYLAEGSNVSPGDRVLTSGNGGAFPPGLPIGAVSEIRDRTATVQPFVDWSRLDYVRLLDYGLKGFLPPMPTTSPPVGHGSRKPVAPHE